jgi:hypothetical protein
MDRDADTMTVAMAASLNHPLIVMGIIPVAMQQLTATIVNACLPVHSTRVGAGPATNRDSRHYMLVACAFHENV